MNLQNIVGHKKQINFLRNLTLDNLHHSWIFYGKKGIGKYSTLISFLNAKLENRTNFLENIFKLECDIDTSIDDIREIIRYSNLISFHCIGGTMPSRFGAAGRIGRRGRAVGRKINF